MATIIDAHAHLWLKQDTVVDDLPIRTLDGGRSLFMGEIRQMVPPFMVDGVNSAEVMLSNMDYAQVSAAVITQEYIDGIQNDYLMEVARRYVDNGIELPDISFWGGNILQTSDGKYHLYVCGWPESSPRYHFAKFTQKFTQKLHLQLL